MSRCYLLFFDSFFISSTEILFLFIHHCSHVFIVNSIIVLHTIIILCRLHYSSEIGPSTFQYLNFVLLGHKEVVVFLACKNWLLWFFLPSLWLHGQIVLICLQLMVQSWDFLLCRKWERFLALVILVSCPIWSLGIQLSSSCRSWLTSWWTRYFLLGYSTLLTPRWYSGSVWLRGILSFRLSRVNNVCSSGRSFENPGT